ncbi:hypothetical protein H6G00_01465 [Leptolyngbya sp. FACHB-541]|uniref:hypothetical protein n=1 Tax=Leptolyngbya sp. FACHB-541 TaxID=2692810 RepID=UPI0016897991|nr:hypothetical protein [Leptolyngbya sp. FACHB-541]MBD1995298.1 hypothetical protein [Leptolyngbya sp. FACHB-541]
MNPNLIEQMIDLRDLAAPLAEIFGVPTVRGLVIQHRYSSDISPIPVETLYEIEPHPVIVTANASLGQAFSGAQNITIEIDDFQIKGISRRYTYEQLVGTGINYWVDAKLHPLTKRRIGGVECDFVAILQGNTLTWDLILRRKPDHVSR